MAYPSQNDGRRYPRGFMRDRLARICTNHEDPITSDVWAELGQANLHPSNFISLIQNHTMDILIDSPGERHCYVLKGLYRWVTSRYGAVNPLTGELIRLKTKANICMAYFSFLGRKYNLTAEENRHFRLLNLFGHFIIRYYMPLLREVNRLVPLTPPEERGALLQNTRQRLVNYFDLPRYRQLKPVLKIRFDQNGFYF